MSPEQAPTGSSFRPALAGYPTPAPTQWLGSSPAIPLLDRLEHG